jgi:hypothetical protein
MGHPSGHPYPQKLNIYQNIILYYTNVKYIHLNTIIKFLASFNHPFNTPKIINKAVTLGYYYIAHYMFHYMVIKLSLNILLHYDLKDG